MLPAGPAGDVRLDDGALRAGLGMLHSGGPRERAAEREHRTRRLGGEPGGVGHDDEMPRRARDLVHRHGIQQRLRQSIVERGRRGLLHHLAHDGPRDARGRRGRAPRGPRLTIARVRGHQHEPDDPARDHARDDPALVGGRPLHAAIIPIRAPSFMLDRRCDLCRRSRRGVVRSR